MVEKRIINGWYKLRYQVLERDNFTCQYCGKGAPDVLLEVDHKVSIADGGSNDLENLITSCGACNRGKSGLRQALLLNKARGLIKTHTRKKPSEVRQLLKEYPNGLTVKEIKEKIDITDNGVRVILSKLKARGQVENPQLGLWRIKIYDFGATPEQAPKEQTHPEHKGISYMEVKTDNGIKYRRLT